MVRRIPVMAAVALLAAGAGAGCSSTKGSAPATSVPGTRTLTTTVSARRVALIGAEHVARSRALLAVERRFCGGANRIAPRSAALARRCNVALIDLAAEARGFARALVYLRAPVDLEPLVAHTIDAARPLIALVHSYPARDCLIAPLRERGIRAARCDKLGRDVAVVITEFEQGLDKWSSAVER